MKTWIIACGVLALLLGASQLLATPPDSLGLSFDSTEHVLAVRVFHPVKNLATHYISKVTVARNDTTIITQQFGTQTDAAEQDVSYTIIDAKPGDKLTVTGTCSIMGKKSATLEVPVPAPDSSSH